jgi:hypothetical protein
MVMKKNVLKISLLSILLGLNTLVFSQWDLNGNIGVTGANYVGTNNAAALQLRTTLSQPIIFQTNGATERMRLTQTGFLGLGTAAPVSLFHLNISTATAIDSRFTNSATGATAGDGFSWGIAFTASGNLFFTDGAAGTLNVRT